VKHLHGKEEIELLPYKKPRRSVSDVTVKSLKAEVWDLFSEYIRKRDADANGYCKCCTCGKVDFWKNMQAGHYISRRHNRILFDERNVNAQCAGCNCFGHGKEAAYKEFMLKKYSQATIDTLEYFKRQQYQFTVFELKQMKKMYQEKLSWMRV
jgi:hypothetical protein